MPLSHAALLPAVPGVESRTQDGEELRFGVPTFVLRQVRDVRQVLLCVLASFRQGGGIAGECAGVGTRPVNGPTKPCLLFIREKRRI